jgi:hypothetical protein
MEIIIPIVKYTFVGLLAVELALMARALITVALDKARAAAPAPAAEE